MASNDENLVDILVESTSRRLVQAELQISRTRELLNRSNTAIVGSLRLLGWEDLERFVSDKP